MTVSVSTHSAKKGKIGRSEWLWWITLLALVTLLWCAAYNRWTAEAWTTPVSYEGDSFAEMATAKAMASGDITPLLPKHPRSLGAPFVANWNDHPSAEEGIFAWYALLVRAFGVFAGSNLALLTAHLLAAAGFFFVCRQLNYERIWAFAGAILFAMTGFAFARSLWHLVLTFYWHVPLGLLVVWLCVSTRVHAQKGAPLFCIVVSILHGIQYAYYTGMFLQFLVIAAFICAVRRAGLKRVLFPLCLVGVVISTVVLVNLDTIYYRWIHGSNPAAVFRIYSGLEVYALRPIELLLPATHRLSTLQSWTNRAYYSQTMFQGGENNSLYLGIIGIAGLVALVWASMRALFNRSRDIPMHAWGIAWILAFSVIGGINGLLGAFGLIMFRGTNRYSVVILAIALLFLVRELSRLTRQWHPLAISACAGLVAVIGLWDQVPRPPSRSDIHRLHQQVVSDAQMVSDLESKLPRGAMIFQLPVVDYPEMPPVVNMTDYEHFRAYIPSRNLRFSYGSQKGRTRERWQSDVMQFGTAHAIGQLEKYGFAAVLLNRKGYADRGATVLADLRAAGRANVLAESDDLISIALRPVEHPLLPPEFNQDWYGLEGTPTEYFRWSAGNATIILHNQETTPKRVRCTFGLATLRARHVSVAVRSETLYSGSLNAGEPPAAVSFEVTLIPGPNEVRFETDTPAHLPENGDPRELAFNIRNFQILD